MASATLQDDPSGESFFNVAETETLALFEHLSVEFLEEFDVFAPSAPGRTRDHELPALMRGFLHCYYRDIYGIRPVERELQNMVVWLSCGFDRPPSRDAVDRFPTDLEHVVDEGFDHLVEQAAHCGLLDVTDCIDATDVRTMPADQDASKCDDLTDDEYYYGYGCTIGSTGQKIPIAAEFTESNQALEETAMRVTRDALAVATRGRRRRCESLEFLNYIRKYRPARLSRIPSLISSLGVRSRSTNSKSIHSLQPLRRVIFAMDKLKIAPASLFILN